MNGFGICYILDVCVLPVISAKGTNERVWFLLYLRCLCVVLLTEPNLQMKGFGICYILDVCVLYCYISTKYR